MIQERYELAIGRIREMKTEETAAPVFRDYFRKTADFAVLVDEVYQKIVDGSYYQLEMKELQEWNRRLYEDILPEHYGTSYAEPEYAVQMLGRDYGVLLSFLYTELRGMIPYAFEKNTEYLDILMELFIEIYNQFEREECPSPAQIRDTIYWYASDYTDVFLADRIKDQLLPDRSFAVDLAMGSDLSDLRYLYYFGEYISRNELGTAEYLGELPQELIDRMADVYTEGYRTGFVNTGKDLSKKSTVNIRYTLGFERVVKKAIENFAKMGLKPVIYRASVSAITKRQQIRIGFLGGNPNPQYDYDHRDDQALFLDKKYIERKLEVMHTTYEEYKDQARQMAGPACIETFGEKPFSPLHKEHAARLSKKQEEFSLEFDSRQSRMANQYIPGDERSFTIIAFPVPEIGEHYKQIFQETIRINTLDAAVYERVQQTLIDALDQGEYVHVVGGNGNHTDLQVQLHMLRDPGKETKFENCVADVNIPAGEVFTTPVLEGTNGILHVTKVYLNDLEYHNLELTFSNGMVSNYNCSNFSHEMENKEYVRENVLFKHPTLPLGEFAIGTNTTAYVAAKKYGIGNKMPILIAEKMGPHFAVGDTCYSWSEEIRVYNPNGKEIIAKDNSVSALRKEDVSKAYFHCHTDITVPYEELERIEVVTAEGQRIILLENGRFVLAGTEILNEPLEKDL